MIRIDHVDRSSGNGTPQVVRISLLSQRRVASENRAVGPGRDRGGATGQTMITLSYLLGVLAAIGVIISGVYSYKAAGTEPQAAWDFDPQLRPKNFQQHAFGMVNALERAMFISGSHGKKGGLLGYGIWRPGPSGGDLRLAIVSPN
jgi:hypothetical protein